MEAIEKTETGDAVEPGGNRGDADGTDVLVEAERGNSNTNAVGGKRAGEGAAERYRLKRRRAAKQAILFVKDEFKPRCR